MGFLFAGIGRCDVKHGAVCSCWTNGVTLTSNCSGMELLAAHIWFIDDKWMWAAGHSIDFTDIFQQFLVIRNDCVWVSTFHLRNKSHHINEETSAYSASVTVTVTDSVLMIFGLQRSIIEIMNHSESFIAHFAHRRPRSFAQVLRCTIAGRRNEGISMQNRLIASEALIGPFLTNHETSVRHLPKWETKEGGLEDSN